MRRASAAILYLFLASVVSTPPATAKELRAVKVCGVNACHNVDRADFPAFEEGGEPVDPPKSVSGWYRARLTVPQARPHESFWVALVPSARLVRSARMPDGSYQWMPISAAAARVQQRAATGLKPHPASKLRLGNRPQPEHARVVEVLPPPDPTPDGGGELPWAAGIGLLGLVGAVGGGLFRWRGRRNGA
jgi:hypothetical protein